MFLLEAIDTTKYYACGSNDLLFSGMIPKLVSTAVDIIKIVVPVLLIVYGMMDLGKAVMAQKDDEIKKGQQTFTKRLVAAVVVFLIFFISQTVIGFVAPKDDSASIFDCVDCFLNGNCGKAYDTPGTKPAE